MRTGQPNCSACWNIGVKIPYSTSGGLPPLGGRGIGVASRGLNARVRPNPTGSATPQWGSRTCCRRLPPLGGSGLLCGGEKMTPAWAHRQAELLGDCLVSPDVFQHMVERLRDFAMPYQH